MERRRAVGPISTRRVRIGDPIFPRRPRSRSRSLRLLYFLPFLMKYSKGSKCEKREKEKERKRKTTRIFSQSRGPEAVHSLLLFCLHIKSSSLLCAVCSSTLDTFPRNNDIEQSSSRSRSSRAFCSYYRLQTFTHRESSPHNPAFCVSGVGTAARRCASLFIQKLVCARGWYLLSTIDVRCREV